MVCSTLHFARRKDAVNTVMTQRMKKNISYLKFLQQCSPSERKQLLKVARPEAVNTICDCIANVVHGNIPINSKQKCQLKKKVNVLKSLCDPKKKSTTKKKLLVQHGAGIFSSILGPIIKAIAEI